MDDIDRLREQDVFVHRYGKGIEIHWYGRLGYDREKTQYYIAAVAHFQRQLRRQPFLSMLPSEDMVLRDGDIVVGNGKMYIFKKSSSDPA